MNVLCDSEADLVKSVQRHKYIISTISMAFVVGKIAGKTTLNAIIEDILPNLPDKYIDYGFKVNV